MDRCGVVRVISLLLILTFIKQVNAAAVCDGVIDNTIAPCGGDWGDKNHYACFAKASTAEQHFKIREIDNVLYIGISGTATPSEWMGNAAFVKVPSQFLKFRGVTSPTGTLVHGGFLAMYLKKSESVSKCIQHINKKWNKVVIVGHSLGGAFANFLALEINGKEIGYKGPIQVVTFGSPRVGNIKWKEWYNKTIPQTFRYINKYDITGTVPANDSRAIPYNTFFHVGIVPQDNEFIKCQRGDFSQNHHVYDVTVKESCNYDGDVYSVNKELLAVLKNTSYVRQLVKYNISGVCAARCGNGLSGNITGCYSACPGGVVLGSCPRLNVCKDVCILKTLAKKQKKQCLKGCGKTGLNCIVNECLPTGRCPANTVAAGPVCRSKIIQTPRKFDLNGFIPGCVPSGDVFP